MGKIRAPIEGVFDDVTRKLLGVRMVGPGSNPDTLFPTGDNPAVVQSSMSGFVADAYGVSAQAGRRWSAKGVNAFWDFRENAGTTVRDQFASVPLALVGSGTFWGLVPGLFLSKSPILAAQNDVTTPQALLRRIFDLTRLHVDRALTIYGVMSHPAPYGGSNNCLMSWGLMNNVATGAPRSGGWCLRLRTDGLLSFAYYGPGMSAEAAITINNDAPWRGNGKGLPGNGNNPTTNTRTAFAVQISRSNANDCLLINSFRRQLDTKEGPDTQCYGHVSFQMYQNGLTSEVSYNAGGSLVLGAEQGTDNTYAQLTNGQEANQPTGLACFGANVGKRDPGLMVRLCRDLEREQRAFPACLTV